MVPGTFRNKDWAFEESLLSISKTTYPIKSLVFKYWPTIFILLLERAVLIADKTPGVFR